MLINKSKCWEVLSLALWLRQWPHKAASEVLSLQHYRISPYSFRHTIVIHLLQSGVGS